MSVAQTTKLTAVLAGGGLLGFALASRMLNRGAQPLSVTSYGALISVPGFRMIILATQGPAAPLFVLAVLTTGFGAGLFSHGTLTATRRSAPKEQTGLALGTWGGVQATAAGIGVALGGIIRDTLLALGFEPALTYVPVFGPEVLFLIFAAIAVLPMLKGKKRQSYLQVFQR